jgi:hypothetical protein
MPGLAQSSRVIPRFGGFNSLFGGREFPVRITTGIRKQGLDLLYHFCSQTTVAGAKSKKFPFRRENRQFLPANRSADWRRALKAIKGNRNFVFPCCVLASGCARLGRGGEAAQAVRRLVRVAPRFRLSSLRNVRFANAARLQSDLDLLREAHLPG